MRSALKRCLVAFVCLMVCACAKGPESSSRIRPPVPIEPTIVLGLETAGSSEGLLYKPNSVAISDDGEVYVLDAGNQRVVVFDYAGNVVRQFGRRGEGPGEFMIGWDWEDSIYLTESTVVVFEEDKHRIQILQPSGEPISGFSFAKVSPSMYSDDHLLYLFTSPLSSGDPTVAVYTPTGELLREFGSGFLDKTSNRIHFLNLGHIAVSKNGLIKQAFSSWPMIRTFEPEDDTYQDRWYDFSWWGDPGLSLPFVTGNDEAALLRLQAGDMTSLPPRLVVFWDIEYVPGPSAWMTLLHKGGMERFSVVQVFSNDGDPLHSYRLLPEIADEEGDVPWPIDIGVSPSGRIMCAVDYSAALVRCYTIEQDWR